MAFPHHYEVQLYWTGARAATLRVQGRPEFQVAPPMQFGGDGMDWSPEELLLGAVSGCFMATFMTLVKNDIQEILSFEVAADGTLDKTATALSFTEIQLTVRIEVRRENEAKYRSLLLRAKSQCIIANSLKANVTLISIVNGSPEG